MSTDNVVASWLQSLGIMQYTQAFLDNGYDDLEICKQIAAADLNAIGVDNASHRDVVLSAVDELRLDCAPCIYFTLEDNNQMNDDDGTLKYHDGNDDSVFADICAFSSPTLMKTQPDSSTSKPRYPPLRCAENGGGLGDPSLHHKHGVYQHNASMSHVLYDDSNCKSLLIYPKVQLKLLLTEKLLTDGINLATSPYTNKAGDAGSASIHNLALRYSLDLNTHVQDVYNRLEELRWTWALAHASQNVDVREMYSPVLAHHTQHTTSPVTSLAYHQATPVKHQTERLSSDEIEPCLSRATCNQAVPDYIRIDAKGMCCILPHTVKVITADNGAKRKSGLLGWLSKSSKRSLKKYVYKMKKGELNARDITMSEEDRMALMLMVKEGRISQDVALEVVKRFELAKKRPGVPRPTNGSPKSLSGGSSASSSPWHSPVILTLQTQEDTRNPIDSAYNNSESQCESCLLGIPHNYADTGCLYGRCRSSRSTQPYRSMSRVTDYDTASILSSPFSSHYSGCSPHRVILDSPRLAPMHSASMNNRLTGSREFTVATQPYKSRHTHMTSPLSSGSDTSLECPATQRLPMDVPRSADLVHPTTNSSSPQRSSPFGTQRTQRDSRGRVSRVGGDVTEPLYSTNRKPGSSTSSTPKKCEPRTVEELLVRIGLWHVLTAFTVNGYDSLDKFVEIHDDDLDKLGINDPAQRIKILTAAALLSDFAPAETLDETMSVNVATTSVVKGLSPSSYNRLDHDARKDSGCYDSTDNQAYDPCRHNGGVPAGGGSVRVQDVTDEDREVSGITALGINQRNIPATTQKIPRQCERNLPNAPSPHENSRNFPLSSTNTARIDTPSKSPDSLRNIQDIFYSLPCSTYCGESAGDTYSGLQRRFNSYSPDVETNVSTPQRTADCTKFTPKFHRYYEVAGRHGVADAVPVRGNGSLESSDCTSSDMSDSSPFKKTGPSVLVNHLVPNNCADRYGQGVSSFVCSVRKDDKAMSVLYREENGGKNGTVDVGCDNRVIEKKEVREKSVKSDRGTRCTERLDKICDRKLLENGTPVNGCTVNDSIFLDNLIKPSKKSGQSRSNEPPSAEPFTGSPSRFGIRSSGSVKAPSRTLSNGSCDPPEKRSINLMTSSFNASLKPKNTIFDMTQYVINKDSDRPPNKAPDSTVGNIIGVEKSPGKSNTPDSGFDQCPEVSRFPDSRPVSVDDLLATVSLQKYSELFHGCGYSHATQLLLLKETDLRELGVCDHKHVGRLQHALDVLRMKHLSPTHHTLPNKIDKV